MNANRKALLDTAHAELGTVESPAGSNKTKYGEWYGMNGVKWCAIFVSWVYDRAGFPLGAIQAPKGIHHCQAAHNYFKSKNMLVKEPQPGDIVLFDWRGDGHADHIGIFKKWTNSAKTTFESYEGNTATGNDSDGGKVMLRNRSLNSVKSFVSPEILGRESAEIKSDISVGDRGADVVKLQKLLIEAGHAIVADGWFGNKTKKAVTDFQESQKMNATGIADTVTIGALQEFVSDKKQKTKLSGTIVKAGYSGEAVIKIQERLNEISKAKIAVTGIFDAATTKAVKDFQKAKSLKIDGIVGPKTLNAMNLSL
ncbi:peptidoglycan-binding protein [Flavobacterium sp.]|uniref:peptidoglycan-binding protein n=1 Tax=Flavobacterium sp. TaxID=239 RepID=UPI002624F606|nr:peptidoglycan-binding protein [Flavobacterium sp.]